ncbi:MAG: hypothetical protein LBP35_01540 [Candidatus Ancillula trichonymphae]|nr:hypothetical protein [Candidatus Ancillula trichonymphae]
MLFWGFLNSEQHPHKLPCIQNQDAEVIDLRALTADPESAASNSVEELSKKYGVECFEPKRFDTAMPS